MSNENKIITDLSGHFLLATANLEGTYFEDTVVFICTHEDEMTLGLVINQEMIEINFEQILESLQDEVDLKPVDVVERPMLLAGGPVEIERGMVIHSDDYESPQTISLSEGVCLTSTAQIVEDIVRGRGPKQYNFCMGYAGWSPHQLEEEIANDDWMVVPANKKVLFSQPVEERYAEAAESMGLNFSNFSGFTGEA